MNKGLTIEELMNLYRNDIVHIANLYTQDFFMAEDICQETYIKINQKINSFRGESSIKTWITRIAINTAKDYIKSSKNDKINISYENEMEYINNYHYTDYFNEDEEKNNIKNVISNLPSKLELVIKYVYYAGFSIKETAVILDIAEGTVKSRIHRAKEILRESMNI